MKVDIIEEWFRVYYPFTVARFKQWNYMIEIQFRKENTFIKNMFITWVKHMKFSRVSLTEIHNIFYIKMQNFSRFTLSVYLWILFDFSISVWPLNLRNRIQQRMIDVKHRKFYWYLWSTLLTITYPVIYLCRIKSFGTSQSKKAKYLTGQVVEIWLNVFYSRDQPFGEWNHLALSKVKW